MSARTWSEEDGLVSVTPETRVVELLEDARARGLHLGSATAHHRTVQDALDANDPLWAHRLSVATVDGLKGELHGPMAPRAAVGPDLACFALGARNALRSITFRAERAVSFGRTELRTAGQAAERAQMLAERGCTLIEITEDRQRHILTAALPRDGLKGLLSPVNAPPIHEAASHAAWPVSWRAVGAMWNQLSSELAEHGTPLLQALDAHLGVLRLVAKDERAPDPAVLRTITTRYLGTTRLLPPDLALAFRLRPLATGSTRA